MASSPFHHWIIGAYLPFAILFTLFQRTWEPRSVGAAWFVTNCHRLIADLLEPILQLIPAFTGSLIIRSLKKGRNNVHG